MTISRRLPLLAVCALPLAIAAGCATETEPLPDNEASISEAPEASGKLDAGGEITCKPDDGSKLDAGSTPDAGSPTDAGLDGGQETEPSSRVRVKNITASGSGCPAGSWTYESAGDSIALKSYGLSFAPGKPTLQSTNCTVTVAVEAPAGESWGVSAVEYAGEATVDPTIKAEIINDIALTGLGTTAGTSRKSAIDDSGRFGFRDDYAEPAIWSRCDITSNLQIRTRLTLTASAESKSNAEVRLQQVGKIRFVTRPCAAASKATP